MIVVDTSALIAILNHEPERTALYEAIAAAARGTVRVIEASHNWDLKMPYEQRGAY